MRLFAIPRPHALLCSTISAFLLCACASTKDEPLLEAELPLVPAVAFEGDNDVPILAERMKRYGVPGLSVAFVEGDRIILSAFGARDADSRAPITTDLLFQAASISKPVTAVGVMTLVDRGLVSLDDPANDYLVGWSIPPSPFSEDDPITIRELLSHSGGISVPSYPGFERGAQMPSLDEILVGAPNAYSDPVASVSSQGTYRYSGGGFQILEKVIEDVSGEDFEQYMQREVFGPLGMTRSTFVIQDDPEGLVFGHNWKGERREDPWQDYPQRAAAGLWSTPEDLARLLIGIGQAYRGSATGVISPNSAREIAIRVAGDTGLGFGVHGEAESLYISHAGWTIGYRSNVLYFPERREGLVVMTNADAGHHQIADIQRTVGKAKAWPGFGESLALERAEWSAERSAALEGTYQVGPAGFPIDIKQDRDGFELSTPRGSSYRLIPTGPNSLIIEETGERVEFDAKARTLFLWGMLAQRSER
jgi:CubicO group peptidase (beta-lactamase class C family)